MRLFRYTIHISEYYPFGDSFWHEIKDIVQVNNDELDENQIKDLIIKKLELSTEYKEDIGHSYVTDIELKQIMII
jgi:hypothetical protein